MLMLQEWEKTVPPAITGDVLWNHKVYRLSLYAADVGWEDVTKLAQDRRTSSLSDQLNRALGSISSNYAEGFSRGTGRARATFYEYSLGSARESRDWYYKARHVLGEETVNHRLTLQSEIIRLLLTILPNERQAPLLLRESTTEYEP